MPAQAWKLGKEFNVAIGNILSDGKEGNGYGKMDSLGRFTLKMPILNSSEAFLDWGRTTNNTLLEPGKTYFLLYDFTTGQKLWMGDDVRLQNELLAYPHDWNNDHITDNEEGKITAMQFKARTDAARAASMNKLQNCLTQHPNLSQRYIDYLTGYYQTSQGCSMMQARYDFPDLPKEYMDYVSQELWQKANKPYTLYRDFGYFMRDYIDHITTVDNTIRVGNHGITLGDANNAFFLRCKQAEGKVTLSDEDLADLDRYTAANMELYTSQIQKNKAAGAKNIFDIDSVAFQKFAQQDFVQHYFDIMAREDIKKVMQEEWPLINLYAIKRVLDASGADQSLHDIALARKLFWQIDSYRKSLEPVMMAYAEKEIKTPAAFNYVKAANDKYLALERQDFANAASLRPSSDVEGMSDGEKIFRKILEPFKGRIVYLDVWGTWCGPCKRNLKESWKVKEQLKNYDIVYLYLCNRSSDEAWKNVIKEYNLTGENCVHYNLPEDQQSAVENYLNIHSYPTYKLIDKQGNIHDLHWLHHEDMKSFLETIDKLSK
jgi:thiol-disulfide isomerase/thioredoxin